MKATRQSPYGPGPSADEKRAISQTRGRTPRSRHPQPCPLAPSDALRQAMAALAIGVDEHGCSFGGHRYERCKDALADAIDHARLVRSRDLVLPARYDESVRSGTLAPPLPGMAERCLMTATGVTYATGRYASGGFRYERLADAVEHASGSGAAVVESSGTPNLSLRAK